MQATVQIHRFLDNVRRSTLPFIGNLVAISMKVSRWRSAPIGHVKLNIDAAIYSVVKRVGLGAVVRDHDGRVLLSANTTISHIDDALHAEVRALLFGLEFVQHRGFQRVFVESDSQIAVIMLNSLEPYLWSWGMLIQDL